MNQIWKELYEESCESPGLIHITQLKFMQTPCETAARPPPQSAAQILPHGRCRAMPRPSLVWRHEGEGGGGGGKGGGGSPANEPNLNS